MDVLSTLVDAALSIEKVRVRTQVRKTHLELDGRNDPETDALYERLVGVEEYVDGRVASIVTSHPAYPWFSKVKGIGKENIAKVVGQIDILKAPTISALWQFCGYGIENGKALKRTKGGGKLHYNSQLRSMCWRLGSSLLKAKGNFYDYYNAQKERYLEQCQSQGVKVVPATGLPKRDGKRYEPDGVISEGHVHNRALRKMIKLFLACLWLSWREAEGLPVTEPYSIGVLKHDSMISPWEMVDRAKMKEKTRIEERAKAAEETTKQERAKMQEKTSKGERARH